MKIAIRMDDITPDMDYTKFLRFKELCDLYEIKPLIGVVPDNRDENLHKEEAHKDFWNFIRELQNNGWSVALHGYRHIYTSKRMGCFPLNRLSEFAGKSFDEQFQMLQFGKNFLKKNGVLTDTFMAPAHSFDKNTIKALKQLGFSKITDGFGDAPYSKWGMVFYPISFKQSQSLEKQDGYTTFVVHSNTMNDKDFERYEKMFAEHKEDLISYSELFKITPTKRTIVESIKEYLMAITKFLLVNVKAALNK